MSRGAPLRGRLRSRPVGDTTAAASSAAAARTATNSPAAAASRPAAAGTVAAAPAGRESGGGSGGARMQGRVRGAAAVLGRTGRDLRQELRRWRQRQRRRRRRRRRRRLRPCGGGGGGCGGSGRGSSCGGIYPRDKWPCRQCAKLRYAVLPSSLAGCWGRSRCTLL